jgi:carbon storage regulator CsrA
LLVSKPAFEDCLIFNLRWLFFYPEGAMLVLSRKSRESVVVGAKDANSQPMVTVTVIEIQGNKVRLGFEADTTIPIHRSEVLERIKDVAMAR